MASSSSPSSSSYPLSSSEEQQEPVHEKKGCHKTKLIKFFGRSIRIIFQNENGPCPLVSICNVLLLKNQLHLNPNVSEVSQEQLISLIVQRLIDLNNEILKKHSIWGEAIDINFAPYQSFSDAIDCLPCLITGIDVDIKFHRITDFELTPVCAILNLLKIPYFHGWLVDPKDKATAKAIGSKSYNTLTRDLVAFVTKEKSKPEEDFIEIDDTTFGVPFPELDVSMPYRIGKGDVMEVAELFTVLKRSKIESSEHGGGSVAASAYVEQIEANNVGDEEEMTLQKGELIGNFLVNNASQLTSHGLFSIKERLEKEEICLFFRNNQFNTMIKQNEHLFILVTDRLLKQPDLVWEKLETVNGTSILATHDFKEFEFGHWLFASEDEQTVLESIDKVEEDDLHTNFYEQLAVALQQEEYDALDSQPQRISEGMLLFSKEHMDEVTNLHA